MTTNSTEVNKRYHQIHKIGDFYFIAVDPDLAANAFDVSFTEEVTADGILLRRKN
ncbi:MAG: hypothetical protein WAK50_07925 [Nitrososphaeraceae archaeon]|jgi:hypothetical protein